MTTEIFTFDELPNRDPGSFWFNHDIQVRLNLAGFTGVTISTVSGGGVEISVTEVTDHATMAAALAAPLVRPTLSVNTTALSVTADGVATGTITVTGPSDTPVSCQWSGLLPIDAKSKTLSGGSAIWTFGPTTMLGYDISLVFAADDGSANEAVATVSFA